MSDEKKSDPKINLDDTQKELAPVVPQPPNSQSPNELLETLEESIEFVQEVKATHAKGDIIKSPAGKDYLIDNVLHVSNGVALYRAIEKSPGTEKVVWLKEALNQEGINYLMQETQILSELNLPMFLKIFEQFRDNGRLWVCEEAGEGKTLAESFDSDELTLPRLLSVLAQVAYALAQLHEKGWIHLGVQPSSIIVGKPAKLLDFRWALKKGTIPVTAFFHAGYSAPELLQKKPLDERADIYSIGAILYRAVIGKTIPEIGVQWTDSKYSILSGGVPQILWKCMADLQARFSTMRELHDEITRLVHLCSPTFCYHIAGDSTVGLEPTRFTNQDRYFYNSGRIETEVGPYNWATMAVADGMGGMESGDVASSVAISALMEKSRFTTEPRYPVPADVQLKLLLSWVQDANAKVYRAMVSLDSSGGTTLLCCMLIENRLVIAHVGDCRLYLFRQGILELLTRDHSLAMSLALQGKIPMSEVRHLPERNQLTRSLGGNPSLPEILIDSLEVVTNKSTLDLISNDILILCTDGVWETITEDDLKNLLSKEFRNTGDIVRESMKLIMERGAPDNATMIVLQIEEVIPPCATMLIGTPGREGKTG